MKKPKIKKTKVSNRIKQQINKKKSNKENKLLRSLIRKLNESKKEELTNKEKELFERLKIAEYILKTTTLKNTGKPLKLGLNFLKYRNVN